MPSGPVVLPDDVGHMEAMSVAQHLVEQSCHVTVVTRFSESGQPAPTGLGDLVRPHQVGTAEHLLLTSGAVQPDAHRAAGQRR